MFKFQTWSTKSQQTKERFKSCDLFWHKVIFGKFCSRSGSSFKWLFDWNCLRQAMNVNKVSLPVYFKQKHRSSSTSTSINVAYSIDFDDQMKLSAWRTERKQCTGAIGRLTQKLTRIGQIAQRQMQFERSIEPYWNCCCCTTWSCQSWCHCL